MTAGATPAEEAKPAEASAPTAQEAAPVAPAAEEAKQEAAPAPLSEEAELPDAPAPAAQEQSPRSNLIGTLQAEVKALDAVVCGGCVKYFRLRLRL